MNYGMRKKKKKEKRDCVIIVRQRQVKRLPLAIHLLTQSFCIMSAQGLCPTLYLLSAPVKAVDEVKSVA